MTIDTLSILAALSSIVCVGISSFLYFFPSKDKEQLWKKRWPRPQLFIVAVVIIFLLLGISLFIVWRTVGANFTSSFLWRIGVLAVAAAALVIIMIQTLTLQLSVSRSVEKNKKKNRELKEANDSLNASIETVGMATSFPMSSAYIPLRLAPIDKINHTRKRIVLDTDNPDWQRATEEKERYRSFAPEQAISNYPRCLILGDAGSGKSTLLKYLMHYTTGKTAIDAATGEPGNVCYLPILIELNKFAMSDTFQKLGDIKSLEHPEKALLEFISNEWSKRYGLSAAEVEQYIAVFWQTHYLSVTPLPYRLLLLFDGLDEAYTSDKPQETYERMKGFIERIAKTEVVVVVTSREVARSQKGDTMRVVLENFTAFALGQLSSQDIRSFVRQRITNVLPTLYVGKPLPTAKELIAKLEYSDYLKELAGNPLLLSLIIISYKDNPTLPERRAYLYKQCVQLLIEKWDKSRSITRASDSDITTEQKKYVLNAIGWKFQMEDKETLEYKDILPVIRDFLNSLGRSSYLASKADAEKLLNDFIINNGLLKKQNDTSCRFLHPMFQYYFAACHVVEHPGEQGTLLKNYHIDRWREVILFYVASSTKIDNFIEELSNIPPDYFQSSLVLAGHCLAVSSNVQSSRLCVEIIEKLERALETLNRQNAALALVDIGESVRLRRQFVSATGELVTGENGMLAEAKRKSIADAFKIVGRPSYIPLLFNLLNDKKNIPEGEVRIAVAQALGRSTTSEMTGQLLDVLAGTSKLLFKEDALVALGEAREPYVARRLLNILISKLFNTEDTFYNSILDIIEDIGKIGAYDKVEDRDNTTFGAGQKEISGRELVEIMRPLLLNMQLPLPTRVRIAEVLGHCIPYMQSSELVKLLAELLAENKESDVLYRIVAALGEVGDTVAASALKKLPIDKGRRPTLYKHTLVTLYRLGECEEDDKRKLQTWIADKEIEEDPHLGLRIVDALSMRPLRIEDTPVKGVFQRLLQMRALQRHKSEVTAERLKRLILSIFGKQVQASQTEFLQRQTLVVLLKCGDVTVIEPLQGYVESTNIIKEIRRNMVTTIVGLARTTPETMNTTEEWLVACLNRVNEKSALKEIADTLHAELWRLSLSLPEKSVVEEGRKIQIVSRAHTEKIQMEPEEQQKSIYPIPLEPLSNH